MKTAWFRTGLAAAALVAVSACSSGVSSTAGAIPNSGIAPAAVTNAAMPGRAPDAMHAQRSIAGAALSLAGSGADFGRFGPHGRIIALIERGHAIAHTRIRSPHIPLPTCTNGIEYSEDSNGAGKTTQILEYFYDKACTQPWELYDLTTNYTTAGGSTSAALTDWNSSGAIDGYFTYNASFTLAGRVVTSISTEKTAALTPQTNAYAASGFACLFTTQYAVDCGEGNVITLGSFGGGSGSWGDGDARPHSVSTTAPSPSPSASPSAPGEVGLTATALGTYATPSPGRGHDHVVRPNDGWGGDGSVQIQLNGAGYDGAAGSMTLAAGTPPAWTIAGGTQVDSLTGTATIGFNDWGWGGGGDARRSHWEGDGGEGSVSITLSDSADGLTATLSSGGWRHLSGTVTQTSSGQPVATMSVDYNGNGQIWYTNGTTQEVVDWVVID